MNATTLLQSLAAWVLWNSSGAAVLILLILILRLIAGRAMSARLRSRLWLLVVVRLMIPLLPAVSLPSRVVAGASLLMPRTPVTLQAHESPPIVFPAPVEPIAPMASHPHQTDVDDSPQFVVVEAGMEPASVTPTRAPMTVPVVIAQAPPVSKPVPINWGRILLVTWLAGAAVLFTRLIITTVRLTRSIRLLDPITDPKIVELLASCCELFGIARTPQLLAGGEGSAPALIGVIHPKILLPASLASQLTLDEIRLIFLHELAHLRRRDVLLNYLFAILVALHWFNPLLWIANHRMAADRELACDEAVLQVTSRRHARLYGCTLLKLVELLNFQRLPAGAVGVVQSKTLIQRRIDMIASYPARTARSSLFVRCAAASLALAAAVSAIRAQEAPASIPAPPSASPAPAPSPSPSVSPGSAPSASPVPTPPASPSVSADSAPSAMPAPPAAPFGGSAPSALPPSPAPVGAAPPSASIPPAVDPIAPAAPAAGIPPRAFTAEEIAPVSPAADRLLQQIAAARSQIEALKSQGLSAESKPVQIAQAALGVRTEELKDYVFEWNQNYTLQVPADGRLHAVHKGIVLTAPVAGIAPPSAAQPGALPLVDPNAPVAPAAGSAPPAPSPEDPTALPRGAYPMTPGMPPAPGQPNALPRGEASGYGGGAGGGARQSVRAGAMGGGGGTANGFGAPRQPVAAASVEDAAAREADLEIQRRLSVPQEINLHDANFREALAAIAKAGHVDVVIDDATLRSTNINLNKVSLTLPPGSKPVDQQLALALRLSDPNLDYSIYNGVVFVSARFELARHKVTRIYDLPTIDPDLARNMVLSAVGEVDWYPFDKKVVVTASELAQRDIARLFVQLEQATQPPKATKAMFLFRLRNTKAAEVAAQFPKELGTATADDRTNSVLVTARRVDQAKDLVAKLDQIAGVQSDLSSLDQQLSAANVEKNAGPATRELSDAIEQLNSKIAQRNIETRDLKFQLDELYRQAVSGAAVQRDQKLPMTTADGLVRNLEETLAMMQSVYSVDSPQIKRLESQLAAARVQEAAQNNGEESGATQLPANSNSIPR